MLKKAFMIMLAAMMISAVSAFGCGAEKSTKAEKTSAEIYSCNSNEKGAMNTTANADESAMIQNAAATSDSKGCAAVSKDAKAACVKSNASDVKSTSADKSGSCVSKSADMTTASSTSAKSQCPYTKSTTASSGNAENAVPTDAAKITDQTGNRCNVSMQSVMQKAAETDGVTKTDKTAMIDKK